MAISSNRAKKTYSFFRQRPVASENYDDANRMSKTYGSVRHPEIASISEPVLISLNYDLADTAGGDSITIDGTGLSDATSCTVDGTSATITANTSTSLTFTMPAKTAGTYDVQVTTASGLSNTLSIEAWDPSEITGIDAYFDSRKGVTLSSGTQLSKWTEQSASRDYTAPATPPNKIDDVFGTGIPAIRFSPNQYLTATKSTLSSGLSYFHIAKWTSTDTSYSASAADPPLTLISDNGGSVYNTYGASAGMVSYVQWVISSWVHKNRGSKLNDGSTRLVGVTHDTSGNWKAYVGSTQVGVTATGLTYEASYNGYVSIGSGYLNLDGWDGDVGAVIIVSGVISNGDLTKLQKWARVGFGAAADATPSPVVSLRADTGITKDGSNKVSAWDSSVGSTSLAQATSGYQPTWSSSDAGFNNQPVISFDGTDDYLQGALDSVIANGNPFVVFLVASMTAGTYFIDGNDATGRMPVFNNSGPLSIYDNTASYLSSGVTASGTGAHVIACRFSSAGNVAEISVDQGTAQASGESGAGGLNGITVGNSYAIGAPGQIKVAELRVYDSDLNSTQRKTIMDELGSRYGITVGT